MTAIAIIALTSAALSWIAVRRCPLARAVSCQIEQVADSSH